MHLARCAVLSVFAFCPFAVILAQVDRITGRSFATRSEVIAQHGMVCTSQPLATQAGLDVLKAGGSAVDAAIAANAALGLMEPVSSGVGGDLFAIVWDAKTQRLYGLNASGRSPQGLSYEQMKAGLAKLHRTTIPPFGMLPVSVPGAVDGWFELHAKFGRMPMAQVLAPADPLRRGGVSGQRTHRLLLGPQCGGLARPAPARGVSETYAPAGHAPAKGEIFRNPALARTYRLIAVQGRDVFYRGEIADRSTRSCAPTTAG